MTRESWGYKPLILFALKNRPPYLTFKQLEGKSRTEKKKITYPEEWIQKISTGQLATLIKWTYLKHGTQL